MVQSDKPGFYPLGHSQMKRVGRSQAPVAANKGACLPMIFRHQRQFRAKPEDELVEARFERVDPLA